MKKIKLLFMSVCVLTLLVGCGCNKKGNDKDKPKDVAQIEETINDLYTDEEKLVYNVNDIYKIVFRYENDIVTGEQHYYEYKDEAEAEAKYKEDSEKLKNDTSIKKITKSGKYVVYTMAGEGRHEGQNIKTIKESFSYLLPVYEK